MGKVSTVNDIERRVNDFSYAYTQGHLLRKEKGFTSSDCHKKGSNVTEKKAIITEADLVSLQSFILAHKYK